MFFFLNINKIICFVVVFSKSKKKKFDNLCYNLIYHKIFIISFLHPTINFITHTYTFRIKKTCYSKIALLIKMKNIFHIICVNSVIFGVLINRSKSIFYYSVVWLKLKVAFVFDAAACASRRQ